MEHWRYNSVYHGISGYYDTIQRCGYRNKWVSISIWNLNCDSYTTTCLFYLRPGYDLSIGYRTVLRSRFLKFLCVDDHRGRYNRGRYFSSDGWGAGGRNLWYHFYLNTGCNGRGRMFKHMFDDSLYGWYCQSGYYRCTRFAVFTMCLRSAGGFSRLNHRHR